jgi:hypothetical protein
MRRASSINCLAGSPIITSCIRTALCAIDHPASSSRTPARLCQAFKGQQQSSTLPNDRLWFGKTDRARDRARCLDILNILKNGLPVSSIGIGPDQARIDNEVIATDQPLGHTTLDCRSEQLAQQAVVAEVAMAVFRELEWSAHRPLAQVCRTSDKLGSDAPRCTTAARNESSCGSR